MARQTLEFYLTCEDQEGSIDIESYLYQTRCVTFRVQGNILPRFCIADGISSMEYSLKELKSKSYHITNKLSCSEGEVLRIPIYILL